MNVSTGSSAHLGAVVTAAGVNFCVYSKYATRVELLLFDREDAADPCHVVELDPVRQRTYHYWHCQITGIGPGQIYGYRVHGPWQPGRGLRFDGRNLLLDPYGLAVVTPAGRTSTSRRILPRHGSFLMVRNSMLALGRSTKNTPRLFSSLRNAKST